MTLDVFLIPSAFVKSEKDVIFLDFFPPGMFSLAGDFGRAGKSLVSDVVIPSGGKGKVVVPGELVRPGKVGASGK